MDHKQFQDWLSGIDYLTLGLTRNRHQTSMHTTCKLSHLFSWRAAR